MSLRALLLAALLALPAAALPVAADPVLLLPQQGPDAPAAGFPVAVETPFLDEVFSYTESPRTRVMTAPSVPWDRVVVELTTKPAGDPWDRMFGVAVAGVEVLRGTTPRADQTIRRDVTAYASLMEPGAPVDVTMLLGTWVGAIKATLRFEFYDDGVTAALVEGPYDHAEKGVLWSYLCSGTRSMTVDFPADVPEKVVVELMVSGHNVEEFWYLQSLKPRVFHVLVDGVEVANATMLPYVYALVGWGNGGLVGGASHTAVWWSAHQALDVAGVHTGNGEIPPFRGELDASDLPLATGSRSVEIVTENAGCYWITSLSFLVDA